MIQRVFFFFFFMYSVQKKQICLKKRNEKCDQFTCKQFLQHHDFIKLTIHMYITTFCDLCSSEWQRDLVIHIAFALKYFFCPNLHILTTCFWYIVLWFILCFIDHVSCDHWSHNHFERFSSVLKHSVSICWSFCIFFYITNSIFNAHHISFIF